MASQHLILALLMAFSSVAHSHEHVLEKAEHFSNQNQYTDTLPQLTKEKSPPQKNHKLPIFFFGWSFLKPIGGYASTPVTSYTDYSYDNYGEVNTGPHYLNRGISFEIGTIVWFEEFHFLPPKMNLGTMVVFFNPQLLFHGKFQGFDPFFFFNTDEFILSTKVGPSFAYQLTKDLFLEASLLIEPAFLASGDGPLFFSRFNPRINLRMKPIYIGTSLSLGRYKISQQKYPISQMEVTIGLNF